MKALLALLAGLILAGCATMKTTTLLTERDNGRDIRVPVGQTLVVKLASNRTTGYGWAEHPAADPVLHQMVEATYVPTPAPSGMVGVGGVETFQFKAVKAGQESLRIEYIRPWEKNPQPAKTFTLNVSVTP